MRASSVAGTLVVTLLLGGCGGGGPSASTPAASDASSMARSPSGAALPATASTSPAPPSPSAPATAGTLGYDASDADLPPGTYATRHFRVPFTAELDTELEIRDAGDSDRFVFIGQDKNSPLNGDEELNAMLLDLVVDPDDQRSVRPLDDDVLPWFEEHPRFTAVEGSRQELEVDGEPAIQLDLLPSEAGPCGSFHRDMECVLVGYGPDADEPFAVFGGSRLRIVVVPHEDTQLLFAYQATDDDRWAGRASVFDEWVRSVTFP